MEKKYDHLKSEKQVQDLWEKEQTYTYNSSNLEQIYSIDTPPPTVSGSLHIGHIFSYTQTDIIARYKRMSGYNVFYPFGFDDNGLPTEKFVEKKLNIEAYTLERSEFIKLCLKETKQAEQEFEDLWKRIGLSVDWSLSYSTIDFNSRKISQASFIKLYEKGFIYKKEEPAIYCTSCRTTVAQAELEDIKKPSAFNDIIFKTTDNNKNSSLNNLDLVVSTTRPELLPSVSALLYHPDDKRYQQLKNKKATVPIFNHEIPIFEDKDVEPEKGTGLVMVSTFGDKQDIIWAKRYNLPYKQSIDISGKWTNITGPLEGLRVASARKKIIELLQEAGLLVSQKPTEHSVNVHERCKKEVEYLVLYQWFLRIIDFKDKFLELADKINWYPTFMKSRYKNWVENISWDWCLSRQRFYGIPFPVWHCTSCNKIILADIKDLPIDPQETSPKKSCPKCNSNENIVADTDVMDTWNTSSLTPYLCKFLYTEKLNKNSLNNIEDLFKNSSFIPMSMRPQAHDIIRTWAFYTIIKSFMHSDSIPWDNIVISGHVLSTQKEKISKSKGNSSLAPLELLKKYPADAIRYWTASGGLGHDINFSENRLAIGQKLLIKLWNAFRFANMHLENFEYSKYQEKTPNKLGPINEWILSRSSNCFSSYKKYFEKYEFSLALDTIEKFFWSDFCDNYLELIKDQLFNNDNSYTQEQVNSTLWTLYTVGLQILQLYSPFIPHITETIYSACYKNKALNSLEIKSIHQTKFDKYQQEFNFETSISIVDKLLLIIDQVRKLKSENNLSLKTDIKSLTIYSAQDLQENIKSALKELEPVIKGITYAESVTYFFNKNKINKLENLLEKSDNKLQATVII